MIRYRQRFDPHEVTAMNLLVYFILLLTALVITDVNGMITKSYFCLDNFDTFENALLNYRQTDGWM